MDTKIFSPWEQPSASTETPYPWVILLISQGWRAEPTQLESFCENFHLNSLRKTNRFGGRVGRGKSSYIFITAAYSYTFMKHYLEKVPFIESHRSQVKKEHSCRIFTRLSTVSLWPLDHDREITKCRWRIGDLNLTWLCSLRKSQATA